MDTNRTFDVSGTRAQPARELWAREQTGANARFRGLEPLEARLLLSGVSYVDQATDFLDVNGGALLPGDEVVWLPGTAYEQGGLTWQTDAFDSVQTGLNAFPAEPDYTVRVADGTFSESLTLNRSVRLQGLGDSTILQGSDTGIGINITHGDVVIESLLVTDFDSGIYTSTPGIQHVAVRDVTVVSCEYGFHVDATGEIEDLEITDSAFDHNAYGLYAKANPASAANETGLTGVVVSDSSFSHDARTGIYVEKLSWASFWSVTVDDSGNEFTISAARAGIDLNLLRGTYSDIDIQGSEILNSGKGDTYQGAGLRIRPRTDVGTGATLDRILVSGNSFAGSYVGIRIGVRGVPGSGLISSDSLQVNYNDLSNNITNFALFNESQGTRIDVTANWWGDIAGPNSAVGNPGGQGQYVAAQDVMNDVAFAPWLITGDADPGTMGFQRSPVVDVYASSFDPLDAYDNNSLADNDYRRLANAIATAPEGGTVRLHGAFDFSWTDDDLYSDPLIDPNDFDNKSWANGVDGRITPGFNADDYTILAASTQENVTIVADATDGATILGEQLGGVVDESFLTLGAGSWGWTVADLTVQGFDAGIVVAGGIPVRPVTITGNTLTGMEEAVLVEGGVAEIVLNDIRDGAIGIRVVNAGTSGTVGIESNLFTNNGTGLHVTGDNAVEAHNNDFAGNAGLAVARDGAGTVVVDASRNWYGVTDGSQVDALMAGDLSLIDYTPWFDTGDVNADMSDGFQPDYTVLHVGATGGQTGGSGRIQEAIDLGAETIYAYAGTYGESVNVNRPLTLIGDVAQPDQVVVEGPADGLPTMVIGHSAAGQTTVEGLTFAAAAGATAGDWPVQIITGTNDVVLRDSVIDSTGAPSQGISLAGTYSDLTFEDNTFLFDGNGGDVALDFNPASAPGGMATDVVIQGNTFDAADNPAADTNAMKFGNVTNLTLGGANPGDGNAVESVALFHFGGGGLDSTGVNIQGNDFTNNTAFTTLAGVGVVFVELGAGGLTADITGNSFANRSNAIDFYSGAVTATVSGNQLHDSDFGVQVRAGDVTIRNNSYTGTTTGIKVSGGSATIEETTTLDGQNTASVGVEVVGGTAAITNSTIVNYVDAGVRVSGAGAASIDGSTITGNGIGIDVFGGTALVQNTDLTNNTIGLKAANDGADWGVVDAGQSAAGQDFTGLGVSVGGNDFSSYTAAAGPASGAIVDVNVDNGLIGSQGAPWDLTAYNNTFFSADRSDIESVIYHDFDDFDLGYVDWEMLANLTISVTPDTINENQGVTLDGSFTNDPQVHELLIDWDDGTTVTITLPAGTLTFSVTHTFTDDLPSGTPSDVMTVQATVTEPGTGLYLTDTADVTVNNVAPVLSNVAVTPGAIDEGQSVTVSGNITDPGTEDTFTLLVDWGDGTQNTYSYAAGTTSFSETHPFADDNPTGTPSDVHTVNLTLTDDDTGQDTASEQVAVNNVAPELRDVQVTQLLDEGGTATLTGTIVDPGVGDTFTLVVDWGDGTAPETFNYAAGTTSFTETHVYVDDDPTGTPSDVYTVSLTLTDDDTGQDTGSEQVTVNNVAPQLANIQVTSPVAEAGVATLTGDIVDPGAADTFTLVVDWGDGTAAETFNYAAGTTSFSETHVYADDNPTGTPSDLQTVSLTLTDDDTGQDTAAVHTIVSNVAPQLANVQITSPVDEGGTATLTGEIVDPGTQDTFTLLVDWGDGTAPETFTYPAGATSFSETHLYADDDPSGTASDDYTVSLTLTDDDTGQDTAGATVTVNNVAPQLENVSVTAEIDENGTVTLTGDIVDPGSADSFTLQVDWVDGGAVETFTYAAGTTSFSETHQYLDDNPTGTPFDQYIIKLTLADDDTGQDLAQATAVVHNVKPELTNLTATTPIDENGWCTLSADIFDPGTLDTFTLWVDWGDGSPVDLFSYPAGTTSFSETHQYLDDNPSGTAADEYMVQLALADDDTGLVADCRIVTVNNVAPELEGVQITSPVDEGGTATLSGDILDAGTQDSFTLAVDWGDGTAAETFTYAAGTTSFSETHLYVDDNPTGTPSDVHTVSLTLTDDDTGQDTDTALVTVNNVAPQLQNVQITPQLDEGDTATLTGDIVDPGSADTFTLVVDWGDGTGAETFTYAAGTTSFSETHVFADDNPTGTPSDVHAVSLTLTDDDTGQDTAIVQTTVSNVDPELRNVQITSPMNEGGTATLSGDIVDPGTGDTFTLVVDWGDGTAAETFNYAAGTASFSETHVYVDDNPTGTASDSYTVGLTLTDDDTGQDTDSVQVTVNNVAPELRNVQVTSPVDEGATATLSGDIVDPGSADTFTLVVDWGDGTAAETFTYPAGTASFSETHVYVDDNPTGTPSDAYTIGLTLTDDDTGQDTASTTVTVSNVAPELRDVQATSPIDEGGTATLSGAIVDPGSADSFTLVVDWGDGTAPETFNYAAGTTSFSETHLYADDNPTGTPSDVYTIGLTLTDDDTGQDTDTVQVTVNNVAPQLQNVQITSPVDEGGTATLSGDIVDPGAADTFTLVVDWGDGTAAETFNYAAGTTSFSETHLYVDDDPSGTASDSYTVGLTLTDDDTGQDTDTVQVTLNNVAPQLQNVQITSPVDEGGTTTLTGDLVDPGAADTFTLVVDWGDGSAAETFNYAAGTTSFSETHVYADDDPTGTPSDNYTVGLTLTDDDTGQDTASAKLRVNNVAPQLANVQITSPVDEGGTATLTGGIVDPGTADTFTLVVDWGDGTAAETFNYAAGTTSFSETHVYLDDDPSGTPSDSYTVGLTLTDDDTGQDTASEQVTVNNVAPQLANVQVTSPIDEGGTATLTGDIVDPGTADTFTLVVDWGDGSAAETFTYPAGTTSFSETHLYADDDPTATSSDSYTIGLTVTDDDTGQDTDSVQVTVNNVAPQLGNVQITSPVDEGGTATLSGDIVDPGVADTFTLVVDWGDGTAAETFNYPAATTSFSETHVYVDDNPTATPLDNYTVALTLTDDDTGQDADTVQVTVNNVAPELRNVQITSPVDEGATATLSGDIVDPGAADTFTLVVDWGDGTAAETFTYPAGTASFSETHVYVDDDPSGTASDSYTVGLTLTDDDTGQDTASTTVTVSNVAPTLSNVKATPSVIDEGESVTLTGDIADPGVADTFTLVVDWGDGTAAETFTYPAGTASFSETHQYLDDNPSGTAADDCTINLTLTDDDTGQGTASATVTVRNVDPVLSNVSATPTAVDEGQAVTLTGDIADVGTQDTFTLVVDWGDGTQGTYSYPAGTTSFSETHAFADDNPTGTPADDHTVTVTLTDDDTGQDTDSVTVTVRNVAPVLSNVSATPTAVDEGQLVTLSGDITDPGAGDTFTLVVDWGDGTQDTYNYPAGTTGFSETHAYADDDPTATPADDATVTLTLTDDDTGQDSDSLVVRVRNVAPLLENISVTSPINENDFATLTGDIVDPGVGDTFTLVVDWGDGTLPETFAYAAGTTSFSEVHQYLNDCRVCGPEQSKFLITLTLTDDDGGTDTGGTEVIVHNVSPELRNLVVTSPVNENDYATLSGEIYDPGTLDTFKLWLYWGDGSGVQTIDLGDTPIGGGGVTWDPVTRQFSIEHQYLDDQPSGTPTDQALISLTVTDCSMGSGSGSAPVTLNNVAPVLSNLSITPTIEELSVATLTGNIADVGTLDTFALVVDWGDGTAPETFNYAAGTTSFSETHLYGDDDPSGTAADTYTVRVTLTDDDTGQDTGIATVTVNNVAPVLSNVTLTSRIDENGTVTLAGDIWEKCDPALTLVVDWGDGTPAETFNYAGGATSFTETHQYADDNPTGTPSDAYTVNLTLADDDLGQDTASVTVTVDNVDPQLDNVQITSPLAEGGTATLTGDIVDPGTEDTFTLVVDWGDGSAAETFTYPAGTTGFSEMHPYADDNPTGTPSDDYTVGLALTDDDTGQDTDSVTVTVNNVAPTLSNVVATPGAIDEGQSVTVSGDIADPGVEDTFTLLIDWGDGTQDSYSYPAGTTSFSETHPFADDNPTGTPADVHTVNLTLTDDDTGQDTASELVTVNNVAPQLANVQLTPSLDEGDTATLSGDIVDPGVGDTFTLLVDWGDGTAAETFNYAAGTTSFTETYLYADDNPSGTPSDTYTVSLTLTDDDTGQDTASAKLRVNNVAPQLANVQVTSPLAEGATATVSGDIVDPGSADTFTLVVDWGDGSAAETFNYVAGTTGFGETHVYVDDDPTGTPSDNYMVSLTLTDDDTGQDTVSLPVTVDNVAPQLANVQVTSPIDEGNVAALSGDIVDPGWADSFTLVVDWGDGSAVETFAYAAGTTSFSETHPYVDDNPTGTPSDDYTVSLTLTDDDTGQDTASETVTVNNVAPQLANVQVTPSINEDETVTLTGDFTDPGVEDTFTLVVDWGDGTAAETFPYPAGASSFSHTHQYLDDNPSGTAWDDYTVSVTLTDDDTGQDTQDLTVTVNNTAPTLSNVAVAPSASFDEGEPVTLTGDIADPGTQDTFALVVDWGDGTQETYNYPAGTTSFSETHAFADDNPSGTTSDTHNIEVTLTDDDTGQDTDSVQVTVNNVAPQLANVQITSPVGEGAPAALTGDIVDPGVGDTFTLLVDWGDGTAAETFNYAAGTTSFSETHVYADDDPTGTPSDAYTIGLTLTDDDTGQDTASLPVTVNNVAPELRNVQVTSPVGEGATATLTGDIVDPGSADTFTLVVDWGDGTAAETFNYAAGTTGFSETHVYVDDNPTGTPADNYTVSLTLTDDDGGQDTHDAPVTVANVAPVLDNVSISSLIKECDWATLSGTIADQGVEDTFTLVVDWGDGTAAETFTYAAGTASFSETHFYGDDDPSGTPSDDYTVALTLTDDDTGQDTASVTVTVENVPPILSNVGVTPQINENGTVVLTGDISDKCGDSFTLLVDWGDGTGAETFTYAAGTASFSETHKYLDDDPSGTASDTYTVTLTLSDDDTGQDTDTATVTVENIAPRLRNVQITSPVDEGGTATLTGDILDPGIQDTFTLVVDWGDGTAAETFNYGAGTTSFSETHVYADDDPTGTPSDDYTVSLTLTDDDTGQATASAAVTVDNVAPQLANVQATSPTDEGALATLTGDIVDPGSADTFTLVVDWGDGSAAETFNYGAGTTSFSETHVYVDDNPTGTPSDDYTVSLTLTDDDGGQDTADTTVTVDNVAPQLANVQATSPIDEGDTVTLAGDITDPGAADTFTLVVDWGDGTAAETFNYAAGTTSFSETHVYPDDDPSGTPSDDYTVGLTLTDDDGGQDTATATVTVNNVAPQLQHLSATSPIDEGGSTTLSGMVSDPGTQDVLTLTIDWGDASTDTIVFNPGDSRNFSVDHQYADDDPTGTPSDTYTIGLTLTDDDTGLDTASEQVTVNNVAPQLANVQVTSPVDEGGTATLSGDINDPGTGDTFTLVVDWGDGTAAETFNYAAGTTGFSETHVYVDDNPSGTPSDNNTVRLTLTDDDTGQDTDSLTVTVNNVAPTATIDGAPASVPEGTPVLLNAVVGDPGVADTFTYAWEATRDGITHATGTSASFIFIPDCHGPVWEVTLSVTDDDTGVGTDAITLNVENIGPTISVTTTAGYTNPVDEGTEYSITLGTVQDPCGPSGDTVFGYIVSWGDDTFDAHVGTPANPDRPDNTVHTHTYDDGTQNYPISIKLFDLDEPVDGWEDAGTQLVIVNNVAPEAWFSDGGDVEEGSEGLVLFHSQHDPSTADTSAGFRYWYDFNSDGIWEIVDSMDSMIQVPAEYLTDGPGIQVVTGRIIDKDDGFNDYTAPIDILNVPVVVNAGPDQDVDVTCHFVQVGSFTDPGEDVWTATVNYGDGSGDQPLTLNPDKTFLLNHRYDVVGVYTVTVTVTEYEDVGGTPVPAADTAEVDVVKRTFRVVEFTPTPTGFEARFNRTVRLVDGSGRSLLNLYDGPDDADGGFAGPDDYAPADIVVTRTYGGGALTEVVSGSMVWNPDTYTMTWVQTGGRLADGSYEVLIRSGDDAFRDDMTVGAGGLLDGNEDDVTGDDYVSPTWLVGASGERFLAIPDFARGARQFVVVPNVEDSPAAGALPVSISNAAQVTSVDFDVLYDANMLEITGASLAAGMPSDWSITTNASVPGRFRVSISGATRLSGTDVQLVLLDAKVADAAPYGQNQAIRLTNLSIATPAGNVPALGDVAVHQATYFGDTDGNAFYTGLDAAYTAMTVVGSVTGFDAADWVDPLILADINSDGVLTGEDAAKIAQEALGDPINFPVPEIPDRPAKSDGGAPEGRRQDQTVLLSMDELIPAHAGDPVTVLLNIDGDGADISAASVYVYYDTDKLDIERSDVTQGSLWTPADGWTFMASARDDLGLVTIILYSFQGVPTYQGDIASLEFTVKPDVPDGVTTVLDVEPFVKTEGGLTWNESDGSLLISDGDAPPTVEAVLVGSDGWWVEFLTELEIRGVGDADYGYAVPDGGDQLAPLPWVNLNKVSVVFSEEVSVEQDDLEIKGVNADYTITGFTYTPADRTATWTLSENIAVDKLRLVLSDDVTDSSGNALDGEWVDEVSTFGSGDGAAGGDFRFRMNVLPGDVDQSGRVRTPDWGSVRALVGAQAGDADYSILHDVDGSGSIRTPDWGITRSHVGDALPDDEPPGANGLGRGVKGKIALALPAPQASGAGEASGLTAADLRALPADEADEGALDLLSGLEVLDLDGSELLSAE